MIEVVGLEVEGVTSRARIQYHLEDLVHGGVRIVKKRRLGTVNHGLIRLTERLLISLH